MTREGLDYSSVLPLVNMSSVWTSQVVDLVGNDGEEQDEYQVCCKGGA